MTDSTLFLAQLVGLGFLVVILLMYIAFWKNPPKKKE